MSPREAAQHTLAVYLIEEPYWNAPYGTLEGLQDLPRGGKVRTVTFGVRRVLDATAYVWSPGRIEIRGQGALAYAVAGTFDSVEAAIEHLRAVIPGRA